VLHDSGDVGSEVWIVLADLLVGLLAVVLLVGLEQPPIVPTPTPTPTFTPRPPSPTPGAILIQPPAVEHLKTELESLRRSRGERGYRVFADGFDVHIIFEETLLFKKCEWTLNQQGEERLKELAHVLWGYDSYIERIQIEGHADTRPAESCSSLSKVGNVGLPKDNLLLSSFRAMAVQQQLIQISEEDVPTAPSPSTDLRQDRLKKLEAVGRGDSHPMEPHNPNDPRNRRIEITVHFIGPGKAEVPN